LLTWEKKQQLSVKLSDNWSTIFFAEIAVTSHTFEQASLTYAFVTMKTITVTAFRYKPLARFRAFANMGRVLMQPLQAEGLQFSKLMGSGIDFGLVPDLSTYVFLGVWDTIDTARSFSQTAIYKHLSQGTTETGTLYLQPEQAHGLWDGINPFATNADRTRRDERANPGNPVAVLTRATIRPRALPDFWSHVPQARQRLADHADQLLFGIGVGEVPLVQQCTVSVWRSSAAVDQYAYRQSGHKEVVRLTRERKWYSEELFARFTVLQTEGTLFANIQSLIS
jgi:hypothetical protein